MMFPVVPFGPLSLPTGPLLAIIAVVLGLEVAGRYAKRCGLLADDLWNTGLLAIVASLIVARFWNVFQFWYIYRAEPWLIVSIRPGGFAPWPGLLAALVTGYLYLLRKALDPTRAAAAFSVGALAAGSVLALSAFLNGTIIGVMTSAPWAMPYYGELRHPAALYQALGLLAASVALWFGADSQRPGRVVLLAGLGYSLVRLLADGFVDNAQMVGTIRVSQAVALIVALTLSLALARGERGSKVTGRLDDQQETSGNLNGRG